MKLCDCTSKRSCFVSNWRGTRIQDGDKNRKKEMKEGNKNIYKGEVFLFEMRNKLKGSELGYFKSTQRNDSATNFSR